MSLVPQNVLDFVLDCWSGELDLGTLGSYSGSPFLTPDAFLRSPDKDVLGEDNDLLCCFASPFTIFSRGCLFKVLSAVRMYGCSFFSLVNLTVTVNLSSGTSRCSLFFLADDDIDFGDLK